MNPYDLNLYSQINLYMAFPCTISDMAVPHCQLCDEILSFSQTLQLISHKQFCWFLLPRDAGFNKVNKTESCYLMLILEIKTAFCY